MKILRNLHQRITGVLGHDFDGRPLRVGDEVMILPRIDVRPQFRGLVVTITGKLDDGRLTIDVMHPNGECWNGSGHVFRKIDYPDSASWDQVTESTGWKPSREKAPAKTEEVSP